MEVECDKRRKQLAEGQLESEIAHLQQRLQEENLVSHEIEEYLKKQTAVWSTLACTPQCPFLSACGDVRKCMSIPLSFFVVCGMALLRSWR